MRLSYAIATAIFGFGMLAAPMLAKAGTLDGNAIRKIFPGYFEATVQGYRVLFKGAKSGAMQGQAYGQQDRGRWYVKGDKLCVVWQEWTKGKAKCGTIANQNGWFVASNGSGTLLKFRRAMVAQQ